MGRGSTIHEIAVIAVMKVVWVAALWAAAELAVGGQTLVAVAAVPMICVMWWVICDFSRRSRRRGGE